MLFLANQYYQVIFPEFYMFSSKNLVKLARETHKILFYRAEFLTVWKS